MPSMTRHPRGTALAERIAALEAERLAPVPRASHVVGVDAVDLALILAHVPASVTGPRGTTIPAVVMGSDAAAGKTAALALIDAGSQLLETLGASTA